MSILIVHKATLFSSSKEIDSVAILKTRIDRSGAYSFLAGLSVCLSVCLSAKSLTLAKAFEG